MLFVLNEEYWMPLLFSFRLQIYVLVMIDVLKNKNRFCNHDHPSPFDI